LFFCIVCLRAVTPPNLPVRRVGTLGGRGGGSSFTDTSPGGREPGQDPPQTLDAPRTGGPQGPDRDAKPSRQSRVVGHRVVVVERGQEAAAALGQGAQRDPDQGLLLEGLEL